MAKGGGVKGGGGQAECRGVRRERSGRPIRSARLNVSFAPPVNSVNGYRQNSSTLAEPIRRLRHSGVEHAKEAETRTPWHGSYPAACIWFRPSNDHPRIARRDRAA